jgi:hypothetical protein
VQVDLGLVVDGTASDHREEPVLRRDGRERIATVERAGGGDLG